MKRFSTARSSIFTPTYSKPFAGFYSANTTSIWQSSSTPGITFSRLITTEQNAPSERLFIGGLSWNTDNRALQEAFARHGDVIEAKVVMDRDTGRSRGFGFVTFKNTDQAQTAKQSLNETTLDGRTINVNFARPSEPRQPRPPRREDF